MQAGHDPPFDLKDERVFHYSLGARAIHRGENVRGLVEMIDGVRRLNGNRLVPFDPELTPLGAGAADLGYALRTETNARAEHWLQLVRGARERLYIGGIAFAGWRGIQGMKETLGTTASSGCEVRVLTMDLHNPAFATMLNPDVVAGSAAGQATRADETRSWFRTALGGAAKAEVRSIKNGMLFQQIIVCDDQMLISPYLYTADTGFSPRLDIKERSPAFQVFLREFEDLWKSNAPS